jgi:predicted RNA-binding Zn ribbon-like protein
MLPVPLNSSKMISSARLPVSTSAVAMIVRLPAPSMLRAAPKKRFGFWSAVRLEAAGHDLSGARRERVVGPGQPGDRIEEDDDVLALLDQPAGLLAHHLGAVHVAFRSLVEGRGHDLALRVAPEVGDLLGPLVDEEQDQLRKRAVLGDGIGDVLQEDRLAGSRRGHDEPALAESDRRQDVHGPHRDVLLDLRVLEQDPLQGVIGNQLLERRDLRDLLRVLPHHLVNPHDRRAALAVPRRLDQHLDLVAALEAVAPDQALGQVGVLGVEPVVDLLVDDERPRSVMST